MNMTHILGLVAIVTLSFSTWLSAQIPTDNPFTRKYPEYKASNQNQPHWTDSIKWNNVIDIKNDTRFNTLVKQTPLYYNTNVKRNDWIDAYNAARDTLYNQGGGVIYFDTLGLTATSNDSSYYFSDDIVLRSNVVLRGAPFPQGADTVASKNNFLPNTYFEFPSIVFENVTSPIDTVAYRVIRNKKNEDLQYSGMVNIDVNKARISIHPTYQVVSLPGGVSTRHGIEDISHLLFMNNRSNNVAAPQVVSGTNGIKRWSWRWGANIDIYAEEGHVLLINNKLNDASSNKLKFTSSSNLQFRYTNESFNNLTLEFNNQSTNVSNEDFYTIHYGILLNRLKIERKTDGLYTDPSSSGWGFVDEAFPHEEPALFAPGNMVMGNFVFKSARVGIQAGGMGLIVHGNTLRDNPNKSLVVHPGGQKLTDQEAQSNENRGIDFAGWDVEITYNDVEFHRHSYPQNPDYTSDGEGIYSQGPSATFVNGAYIAHNIVNTSTQYQGGLSSDKGFNGFGNMSRITNVLIENNHFGCMPLKVDATGGQRTSTAAYANNVVIRNNKGLDQASPHAALTFQLDRVGADFPLVFDNQGCDAQANIARPCNVFLNADTTVGVNDNIDLVDNKSCLSTVECGFVCPNTGTDACPAVSISKPASEVAIVPAGGNLDTVYVKWAYDGCQPDTLRLLIDDSIYAVETVFSTNNSGTVPFNLTGVQMNATDIVKSVNVEMVVSRFDDKDGNNYPVLLYSNTVEFRLDSLVDVEQVGEQTSKNKVTLFPNPARDYIQLAMQGEDFGRYEVRIFDLQGRLVKEDILLKDQAEAIQKFAIEQLQSGMYIVDISRKNERFVSKFIKQ